MFDSPDRMAEEGRGMGSSLLSCNFLTAEVHMRYKPGLNRKTSELLMLGSDKQTNKQIIQV